MPYEVFWRNLNGKEYFIHEGGLSYEQALDYCHNKGLKLVEPRSAQDNDDIGDIAKSIKTQGYGVWIGIDDKSNERQFTYASDGESVKYTNWESGQPGHGRLSNRDEDCVHLWNTKGFRWNDVHCSSKNSFICEHQSGTYILTYSHTDRPND